MTREERRPLVLDAALVRFTRLGYDATSMNAIAAEAGVTKPVLYDCYEDKERLFSAVVEREGRRLRELVKAALPPPEPEADMETLIRDGMTGLLAAVAAAPASWQVIYSAHASSVPAIARRIRRVRDSNTKRVAEVTRAYLTARGVHDAEQRAAFLARAIAGMLDEAVELMLTDSETWPPERLGRMIAAVLARGEEGLRTA